MKALTAEKEAQLTHMLAKGEVENVPQILAMDGPTLRQYTDMPGYWAKMVKDAAQALEDATEDEASQASGAKQLRSARKSSGRKPSVQLEVDVMSEEAIETKNKSFEAGDAGEASEDEVLDPGSEPLGGSGDTDSGEAVEATSGGQGATQRAEQGKGKSGKAEQPPRSTSPQVSAAESAVLSTSLGQSVMSMQSALLSVIQNNKNLVEKVLKQHLESAERSKELKLRKLEMAKGRRPYL